MSDLQCPTRVFVARHGEADYETDLVTDQGGWLSPAGRAQARALGERLLGQRIARVWSSPMSRAVQTAEIAAGVLGVDVVVREGLREYGVGAIAGTAVSERDVLRPVFDAWVAGDDAATIPGGETVAGIAARVSGVLDEVRDAHRGEGVLVVTHGGAMMVTVPVLLGTPRATAHDLVLPGGAHVALEGDASGWRLAAGEASVTSR
jgi:2,3-bisphosphoglycerate-dependent phosphoglycerate mutase